MLVLSCLLLASVATALRSPGSASAHSLKSIVSSRSNFAAKSYYTRQHSRTSLANTGADKSNEIASSEDKFDLSAWLNPNTRGGVIVWSIILVLVPVGFYNYFVSTGMEETKVGATVGAVFVLLSNVAWASTYVFRVANKDMTYAKQLRDYENAVLQKRLDELGIQYSIQITNLIYLLALLIKQLMTK